MGPLNIVNQLSLPDISVTSRIITHLDRTNRLPIQFVFRKSVKTAKYNICRFDISIFTLQS